MNHWIQTVFNSAELQISRKENEHYFAFDPLRWVAARLVFRQRDVCRSMRRDAINVMMIQRNGLKTMPSKWRVAFYVRLPQLPSPLALSE